MLNFLTSDVWFFSINSHLLMFQLLVLVTNLLHILVPPLPLLLVSLPERQYPRQA